jgi:ribose transport system substrate-binding protein
MKRSILPAAALCLSILLAAGCDRDNQANSSGGNNANPTTQPTGPGPQSAGRPRIAYITNGVDPFWTIAEKGAMDAGQKYNADVQVIMPDGAPDQKQKVEDLLTRGIDGIAISPIDAKNQTPMINAAAKKTKLITHDSDAPDADRLLYIGMDNYKAGRMCGKLVKEAIPQGGKVAIFVGRLEQDNARLRRQGVIDELLGRSEDSSRNDPPDAVLKGDQYEIVGTRTDQFDRAQAKANMEDMISRYGDELKCAVGLFAYNPPACLEGIKRLNKLGKVKLVGFDEQDATLQAIKDGYCHGTVVQNPYMYGHESVRILAALHRGNTKVIPPSKFIDIEARQIRKDNVDEFWADLRAKTGK